MTPLLIFNAENVAKYGGKYEGPGHWGLCLWLWLRSPREAGKSFENLRLDTLSRSTRVEGQRLDVIRLNSQNKVFREMSSTLSTHPGHLCHCSINL